LKAKVSSFGVSHNFVSVQLWSSHSFSGLRRMTNIWLLLSKPTNHHLSSGGAQ